MRSNPKDNKNIYTIKKNKKENKTLTRKNASKTLITLFLKILLFCRFRFLLTFTFFSYTIVK